MIVGHLGQGGIPLPFTWGELLENWRADPLLLLGLSWIAIIYLVGWYRSAGSPPGRLEGWRPWYFITGLVALFAALEGPFDRYGDVSAGVHMAQHMVLIYLVAPLLVVGAPLTVLARGLPAHIRGRWVDPFVRSPLVYRITSPWIVGGAYAAVLVATHFTGWYEAALTNAQVHEAEHFAYLLAAWALWSVLLGRDGRPVRRTAGQRMLVVLVLEPVMIVIAVVFIVAPDPLYAHYVTLGAPWGGRASALAAQQAAGGVMWAPSTLATMVLLSWLTVAWYREDEAQRDIATVAELDGRAARPRTTLVVRDRWAS